MSEPMKFALAVFVGGLWHSNPTPFENHIAIQARCPLQDIETFPG